MDKGPALVESSSQAAIIAIETAIKTAIELDLDEDVPLPRQLSLDDVFADLDYDYRARSKDDGDS